MDTDRPRSIPSNIYKFVILSLVTLLQKDIVWGMQGEQSRRWFLWWTYVFR